MQKLEILDKEANKLYELLQSIKANKSKEDKVWEDFCIEMNQKKRQPKKYFKKHPRNISSSSSDVFSPRLNCDYLPGKVVNKARSANTIKLVKSENETPEISDTSMEVVTIRKDLSDRRNEKRYNTTVNKTINKLHDKRTKITSKKNAEVKQVKLNERSPQQSAIIIDLSKKLKMTASESSRGEIFNESHKNNFKIKLHNIIEKSLVCMEDIRIQLDVGVKPPDGLDDLDRRKRRSTEFASRFSRNYLYQLNRQIADIKKILRPMSLQSNNQNNYVIRQKIISAYQTVLQGLQAYLNHLPISAPIAVRDKIKELLREVSTLCDIQRYCDDTDVNSNVKSNEMVDIFEVRSRCLIDKIDGCYSTQSAVNLLQSQSKYSLLETTKSRKKNSVKSRYAMYNGAPNRKDVYWKRAVAALAKRKFNVQSKYKTAHFKHRPPVEKPFQSKPIVKSAKPLERKSSTNLKTKSSMDDENIKTMMELEREKDQEIGIKESTVSLQKFENDASVNSETLIPLLEKLIEKLKTSSLEMSQEHMKRVLQGIANGTNQTDNEIIVELANNLLSQEKLQVPPADAKSSHEDLVEKLVEVIKNHTQVTSKDAEEEEEKVNVDKKKRKERKKTITVTGVKNAQLICIKDEDSILEQTPDDSMKEEIRNKTASQTKPQLQVHNEVINVETKDSKIQQINGQQSANTEIVYKLSGVDRTSRIKISRLPKVPLQPLKMLPKRSVLNILEYKINYLKARKSNHMYKKSSVKQPWTLMGEISDKILDEVLQAIGAEIEINPVIEGIFASEFV